jgi:lipase chaperone LimK
LPRSLRGSDADGGLAIDAGGAFLPTPDAIALFDYFLAASGEEDPAVIRQRIVDQIRGRLGGAAAREAEALLDSYLAFRDELRELVQAAEAPPHLEQRLQWIRELRREHFGPEVAAALFGAGEDVVLIDLERRRVATDASLDAEERAARLAALDARLPESVRVTRQRARAPQRVREEVAALRSAGASEAEVFAVRERSFGAEAADRLAALDAQRAEWERRLAAYQAERDQLLADEEIAALAKEEREAALDALRAAHFEPGELQRVRAIDHFGR